MKTNTNVWPFWCPFRVCWPEPSAKLELRVAFSLQAKEAAGGQPEREPICDESHTSVTEACKETFVIYLHVFFGRRKKRMKDVPEITKRVPHTSEYR